MPRKRKRWSAKGDKLTNNFFPAISETFIMPFFRLPKVLISSKPLRESFAEQRKFIIADVIGAVGMIV